MACTLFIQSSWKEHTFRTLFAVNIASDNLCRRLVVWSKKFRDKRTVMKCKLSCGEDESLVELNDCENFYPLWSKKKKKFVEPRNTIYREYRVKINIYATLRNLGDLTIRTELDTVSQEKVDTVSSVCPTWNGYSIPYLYRVIIKKKYISSFFIDSLQIGHTPVRYKNLYRETLIAIF